MQTSAQFWGRLGFELGKKVDGREHKQATLSSISQLQHAKKGAPGDISRWSMHSKTNGTQFPLAEGDAARA